MSGPGWIDVDHLTPAMQNGASNVAGALRVDSSIGNLGYAIYAVPGFDGNDFPTGLKLTAANVTGNFFIGFSDYVAGTWNFAGPYTGTVESSIPGQDAYTTPLAYVSPGLTHYFCVIPEFGSKLDITALQLGISGGTLGPAAPALGGAQGGDAGVIVRWVGSLSEDKLDFAGYIVQRAPLLSGFFTQLTHTPIKGHSYFDGTAVAGTSYRWRVVAIDVSNNISPWLNFTGGGTPGDNLPPIVHCTYSPKGKLYGPATITFDFTGTEDPEIDAITQYGAGVLYGPPPATSPSPSVSLTLEPGCYPIYVQAKTASNMGYDIFYIKVYPHWQATPVVVRPPDLNGSFYKGRMSHLRMWRNPGSGLLTLFGYDYMRDEYTVRQQLGDGSYWTSTLPGYSPIIYSSEPFAIGSDVYMALANSVAVMLLRWTPAAAGGRGIGEFFQIYPSNDYALDLLAYGSVAAAQDSGGHPWVFYARDDSGTVNLYAKRADGTADPVIVVPNIFALNALDAVYNPSIGRIELAYADSGKFYWIRWNPDTNTIDATNLLDATGANIADIELNPLTNQPAILWSPAGIFTNHTYSERDSGGLWSLPLPVDTSGLNFFPFDLAIANGKSYAWFALATGQAKCYELTATTSTVRNTPADDSTENYEAAIIPEVGDSLVSAWEDGNGKLWFKRLKSDGSDEPLTAIDSTEGQYRQLCTVAASDGLHAIWTTFNNSVGHHMHSGDGGASWSDVGDLPGYYSVGVASNKDGEMYLSYYDLGLGMHCLRRWDSATLSWINAGLDTNGSAEHRPIVGGSPLQAELSWLHWDSVASQMKYSTGNSGGWTSGTITPTLTPLWDGALVPDNSLMTPFYALTVAGGLTDASGGIVSFDEFDGDLWLYSPPGNAPFDTLTNSAVAGNAFAGATAMSVSPYFPMLVFWAADDRNGAPIRYISGGIDNGMQELPISAPLLDFWRRDLRRTMSAATAYGPTAVAITQHLDGQRAYMEWSAFGAFEQLPVPNLNGGVRPSLCVGADGRWHLLVHDPVNDSIVCFNSD